MSVGVMVLAGIAVFGGGAAFGAAVMHAWWATYYVGRLKGWQEQLTAIRKSLEQKERALARHPPEPMPGEEFVIVRKRDWAERN